MPVGSVAENTLTLFAMTAVPAQLVSLVVVSISWLEVALRHYMVGANQFPVVPAVGVSNCVGAVARALSTMRSSANRP